MLMDKVEVLLSSNFQIHSIVSSSNSFNIPFNMLDLSLSFQIENHNDKKETRENAYGSNYSTFMMLLNKFFFSLLTEVLDEKCSIFISTLLFVACNIWFQASNFTWAFTNTLSLKIVLKGSLVIAVSTDTSLVSNT